MVPRGFDLPTRLWKESNCSIYLLSSQSWREPGLQCLVSAVLGRCDDRLRGDLLVVLFHAHHCLGLRVDSAPLVRNVLL
jgi:hypothetical protein